MSGVFHYLSYCDEDKQFALKLRLILEKKGVRFIRTNRKSSQSGKTLRKNIAKAQFFIIILSPATINFPDIKKEIQFAEEEVKIKEGDYKIIPILCSGLKETALATWFDSESFLPPIISQKDKLPLKSLYKKLGLIPENLKPELEKEVSKLKLECSDPTFEELDGKIKIRTTARLIFTRGDNYYPVSCSNRFLFNLPESLINLKDLDWYLSDYWKWPCEKSQQKAKKLEKLISLTGKELYLALSSQKTASEILEKYNNLKGKNSIFSISVDPRLAEGSSQIDQNKALIASHLLLSFPWDLLNNGYKGGVSANFPVAIERRINVNSGKIVELKGSLKILLVTPRPDQQKISCGHRQNREILFQISKATNRKIIFHELKKNTFNELKNELALAVKNQKPYSAIFFDGAAEYNPDHFSTSFTFEDPLDTSKGNSRNSNQIGTEQISSLLKKFNISLTILGLIDLKNQSEQLIPAISMELITAKIPAVISFKSGLSKEATEIFFIQFFQDLLQGKNISAAVLSGQQNLKNNSCRKMIFNSGELHLLDWFLPQYYSATEDFRLYEKTNRQIKIEFIKNEASFGNLPNLPFHGFIGRDSELLQLERLLIRDQIVFMYGENGEGKTQLANELAHGFVRSGIIDQPIYISLEENNSIYDIAGSLSSQLFPSMLGSKIDLELIKDLLQKKKVLLILDDFDFSSSKEIEQTKSILFLQRLEQFCQKLFNKTKTRLLIIAPEPQEEIFTRVTRFKLNPLNTIDSIALLNQVMTSEKLALQEEDNLKSTDDLGLLTRAVHYHARTLVQLAPQISKLGISKMSESIQDLLSNLHRDHENDRELLQFASVELSLRKISSKNQQIVRALSAFQKGANLTVLGMMLNLREEEVTQLAIELAESGLAKLKEFAHLKFNSTLCPFLLSKIPTEELLEYTELWFKGMKELVNYINNQQRTTFSSAVKIVALELPNLILLTYLMEQRHDWQGLFLLTELLIPILPELHREDLLTKIEELWEKSREELKIWDHLSFKYYKKKTISFLNLNNYDQALISVERLITRLEQAENKDADIILDTLKAKLLLARVLREGNALDESLAQLIKLEEQLEEQSLPELPEKVKDQIRLRLLLGQALCYQKQGDKENSIILVELAVTQAKEQGNALWMAEALKLLAEIRVDKDEIEESLEPLHSAATIYEGMGRLKQLGEITCQRADLYYQLNKLEKSEKLYLYALQIHKKLEDEIRQAHIFHQLGDLKLSISDNQQAAHYYQAATDIFQNYSFAIEEGNSRYGLALALFEEGKNKEAGKQIKQALNCYEIADSKTPVWYVWNLLHEIEKKEINLSLAVEARERAIELYFNFRKEGGAGNPEQIKLAQMVKEAVLNNHLVSVGEKIEELKLTKKQQAYINSLERILAGSREVSLTSAPELHYMEVAELLLLLEELADN